MNTAEPIRDREKLKAMSDYFLQRGQIRNHTLFVMGIHTALRIGDLLRLRWLDVYDAKLGKMRDSVTIKEQKTGKSKVMALNKTLIHALKQLFAHEDQPEGSRFIFENKRTGRAISRIQAYRVLKAAAMACAIRGVISCHSLRKTFGYHSWKNRMPLAVLVEIFNHSSFAVTKRYLGITQDDKNDVYLSLNLL